MKLTTTQATALANKLHKEIFQKLKEIEKEKEENFLINHPLYNPEVIEHEESIINSLYSKYNLQKPTSYKFSKDAIRANLLKSLPASIKYYPTEQEIKNELIVSSIENSNLEEIINSLKTKIFSKCI